ncbi:thioredoxin fold domain-containing protein [Massilia sp. erpn]|uniref:thioredoxin fold domain-containing protein n=1 Tax=Massilia sp. erpn TaxID=2738142 RepID=UPI0021037C87|nr:thioredoxin fold domain-containing protein [Massilia sp. erpn]UTY57193.1 thioredoxin fold domain-containing protein [Massilia sp. erpn]
MRPQARSCIVRTGRFANRFHAHAIKEKNLQFRYTAVLVSLGFTMALAHAGLSETKELVKNSPAMKRYKAGDVLYSTVELRETAVPGMYKALNPTTRTHMFYVHEGLDYIVQNNGWSEVKGQDLVLVQGDAAQLQLDKQNILAKLPLDAEMSYKLGDAKRRVVVVVDAFDCAHCRDFDANLKKYSQEYNATVYILPTALNKIPENANIVRSIWCSPKAGAEWREIMTSSNYKAKSADTANCEARKTMETSDDIAAMLRIHGTPGFILGSVNGKAAIAGFPPNSKPAAQKQMLDAIMGKQ